MIYSPAAHGGRSLPIGLDLLTEIYVIYMETHSSHRAIPKFRSVGPSAVAGGVETHGRKARKYIMISYL